MEFGGVILGLEACLRQPDRNDDATLLVALERGRDQRLSPDFSSWEFPSPSQDACGPLHSKVTFGTVKKSIAAIASR